MKSQPRFVSSQTPKLPVARSQDPSPVRDESLLLEARHIELEADASRNLLTTVSSTPPPPQPPPIPLLSPPPQPTDIVRFDPGSDVASGMATRITEVSFSPSCELSQKFGGGGGPRAGDGFEMVEPWGDFGTTDVTRKNNRELERLKALGGSLRRVHGL